MRLTQENSDEDGILLVRELLERYRQQHADARAFVESECKGHGGAGSLKR